MARGDTRRQAILEALVCLDGEASADAIGAKTGRTPAQVGALCRGLRGRAMLLIVKSHRGPALYVLTEKGQERGLAGLVTRSKVRARVCRCGAQVWTESKPSGCPSCGATPDQSGQPWARPILLEADQ